MKYVICLWFIALVFFSCNRKTKQYTLRGRLVNACDGSPDANQALRITQFAKSSGLGGSTKNKTRIDERLVTDANGNFVLVYETNHSAELEIDIDGPNANSRFNLPVENLDLGDIPLRGKSLVYFKLKVNNPYTSADTLLYSELNSPPTMQMTGPFRDTVLGLRVMNGSNDLMYNRSLKKLEKAYSGISVSSSYRIKRPNTPAVNTYSTLGICNTVADTFVVTIN